MCNFFIKTPKIENSTLGLDYTRKYSEVFVPVVGFAPTSPLLSGRTLQAFPTC